MKRFLFILGLVLVSALSRTVHAQEWAWSQPTEGQANTIQQTVTDSDSTAPLHTLLLNEVVFHTGDTDDTFDVELKNISSEVLSLEGWSLRVGNTSSLPLENKKIVKNGYFLLKNLAGAMGDTLTLVDPEGDAQDTFVVPVKDNDGELVSFSRFCEDETLGWCHIEESVPTLEKENKHLPLKLWAEIKSSPDAFPLIEIHSSDSSAKIYVVTHPTEAGEDPVLYTEPLPLEKTGFLFFAVRDGLPSQMYAFDSVSGETHVDHKIYISELVPNPEGKDAGKEWVELWNPGIDSISLRDLFLVLKDKQECTEGEESKTCFTLKGEDDLLPGEHRLIDGISLVLPNTMGKVRLINGQGILFSQVEYDGKDIPEGSAYALLEVDPFTKYIWSDDPTQGVAYIENISTGTGTVLSGREKKTTTKKKTTTTKKTTNNVKKKTVPKQKDVSIDDLLAPFLQLIPKPKKLSQEEGAQSTVITASQIVSSKPTVMSEPFTEKGKEDSALSLVVTLFGGIFSVMTGSIMFKP